MKHYPELVLACNNRLDPLTFLEALQEYKVKRHTVPDEMYHELTQFAYLDATTPAALFRSLVKCSLSYSYKLADNSFTLFLNEDMVGERELFTVAGDTPKEALEKGVHEFINLYFNESSKRKQQRA